MDKRSMINILIGSSRIKYIFLDQIFKSSKLNNYNNKLTLIVDGYSVIYRLYRNEFNMDVYHVNNDVLIQEYVTAFINTIAHYRRYLVTRLHRNNRIYIVFNRSIPKYQTSCYGNYGAKYYDRLSCDNIAYGSINSVIDKATNYLKELCRYFDGIYYLDTDGVEDHAIVELIKREHKKSDILLYSRNLLWLQFLDSRTEMIYPKRDDSRLITKDNMSDWIFRKTKYKGKNINPDNIRHVFACSGCESRDIKAVGISGITRISKMIDKIIDSGSYINNMNIQTFLTLSDDILKTPYSNEDKQIAKNIFNAIDGKLSYKAMSDSQRSMVIQSKIDLYDINGLHELNDSFTDVEDVINITDLNLTTTHNKYNYEPFDMAWMEG